MKYLSFSHTRRLLNRHMINGMMLLSILGLFAGAPNVSAASKQDKAAVEKHLPVSINKANAKELAEKLNGVGQKKAQAIVEWRKENGKFKSIDQLAEVKGIGTKTIDKNRSNITL